MTAKTKGFDVKLPYALSRVLNCNLARCVGAAPIQATEPNSIIDLMKDEYMIFIFELSK